MGGEAKQQEPPEAFPLPLVLAAMQRAQLHGGEGRFRRRELIEHLGLRRTATAKRRLGPSFGALRDEGLIVSVSAHRASHWRLAAGGTRIKPSGTAPSLRRSSIVRRLTCLDTGVAIY
jgi:hypothetical protein